MSLDFETLVPLSELLEHPQAVLDIVNTFGQVVLLERNAPVYVIAKPVPGHRSDEARTDFRRTSKYTLQEAMRIVLEGAKSKQMHAADLADEIFSKGLYRKRNGGKAGYNQIRARCGHYSEMFEALPGNIIKLRGSDE